MSEHGRGTLITLSSTNKQTIWAFGVQNDSCNFRIGHHVDLWWFWGLVKSLQLLISIGIRQHAAANLLFWFLFPTAS